jgi:hypothetical protein
VLSYLAWRRSRLEPVAPGAARGSLGAALLVGSMLGALGAFVPETARNQAITYVAVTGGFVALMAWFRARQPGPTDSGRRGTARPS